jgi:outer membrane protein assembly factor BamB
MKTTYLVRSLLVLMLLAAVGCGDWSRRSGGSGLLIEPPDAARLGYVVNWSTNLSVPRRHVLTSITLLDDLLVTVEAPGNLVTAISVRDGSVRWQRVIGEPTEKVYTPVRDGERIYLNNNTMIFTVGANRGDLIASSKLAQVVETGPVLIGRYAVFGGAEGRVFAHDVDAGYAKWSYLLTSAIVAPPVVSQQNVFLADSQGIYAMLRADSGELIFRGRTFGPVTARPASTRSGVYIASHDQSLYALNRVTGQDKWVYRTAAPLKQSPVALGQAVYLPMPNAGLVALNAGNGQVLWRTDLRATPVKAGHGQVLLLYPGGLRLVDQATGRVVEDAPTMTLQTALPGPDGGLLIVSPGGRVHRLNPKR